MMRVVRESLGWVFSIAPADVLTLIGLVLLGAGLWLFDMRYALIGIGSLLLVAVAISTMRGQR